MAINPSTAVEADLLHCGYRIGYFSKSDIERWADNQIAVTDRPSDLLLDLAILRDTHPLDVLKLLNSMRSESSAEQSIANQIGFIGICFIENKITLVNAVRGLYALIGEDGISADEKSTIYWLDDGYDLAVSGYHGSLSAVEAELHAFVHPYAESMRARNAKMPPRIFE